MAKRDATPIEAQYPTIVIQFSSPQGLPPDMEITVGELAMFLAQGVSAINQQFHVQADLAYGLTSQADENLKALQSTLETKD
jgi:hypothetical protein